MEWKSNPILFAKKIREKVEAADGDVPYSQLENRAIEFEIDLDVLDAALQHLHRFKKVKQRMLGGEIVYSAVPREKPKDFTPGLTWLRENYPYPKNFVMPFPEIDMSYIFMKPDEIKAYRAQAKGIPLYLMNKKISERIKRAVS